jgi:hypothetical protein
MGPGSDAKMLGFAAFGMNLRSWRALPEMRMALAPALRASALEQLQVLLMEASTILEDGREAGDDQDQA